MVKILRVSLLIKRLSDRWEGRKHCEFHFISNSEKILENNIKRDIRKFLKIISDVDKVRVSETSDTKNYVIELIDSKGNLATLWLDGHRLENKVNSITAY